VNTNEHPAGGLGEHRPNSRPAALIVLAVIVFAEFLMMAAAVVYLVWELLVDVPVSYASGVALLVLGVIAAAWLAVLVVNILRAAPWVRAGVIVWQVLQIAVAVGLFQGESARPDVALALLVPALIAIGLALSKPMAVATNRD
jgi:hypothetical protein